MAVDRGELRYKIEIQDAFTNPVRKFREELLKAKNTLEFVRDSGASFRGMQRDVQAATTSVRQFRSASTEGANEERQAQRETARRLREIANEQKKRTQVEKLRADILKQQRIETERAAAAERRAAREAEVAQRRAADATRRNAQEVRNLRRELLGTGDNVNRVAFTFRRLFGILAAFTLARQVVSSFTSLVSSSIQFNRTVEDSAVGLASLFVSAGQVRNEFGQLVQGAEAFKIAQAEAARQSAKLRQDALLTTATYEELLVAFQAAVGPGLSAGLNLDQTREVAVRISQAAAAFGLEQNQLAEEVRSLITGTGQLRTTRLAQVISNEDIRLAREQGRLFELLTERLSAFGLAAEITQQNFTGLLARLQDAAQLASGSAGLAFFSELKLLLGDIGDLFVQVERDADGVIRSVTPDPRAVASLAIVFNGLKEAVGTIRAGIQSLDLTEVQNALALIAGGFQAVAQVAVGVVRGIVGGFSDIAVLTQRIFGAFESPVLQEAAALVTRIGTLLVAGSLAASALAGAVRLVVAPFFLIASLGGKLLTVLQGVLFIIGRLPPSLIPAAAAVAGLTLAFQEVASQILGVQLGIKDLPEVLGATIEQVSAKFFGFIDVFLTSIKVKAAQAFNSLVSEAGIALDRLANLVNVFDLGFGSSEALERLKAAEKELDVARKRGAVAAQNNKLELELTEAKKRQLQIEQDADKRAGDRVQALRNAIESAKGDNNGIPVDIDTSPAEGSLASFLAGLNESLSGLIGGDIVDENAIAEKLEEVATRVTEKLGEITGKQQEIQLTAFDKLIQGLITRSQNFLGILQSSVQGFANFASSAIVDAFDPTKDVDLRERFARLLQDIAKQILQTLITLLIATAIAKAFGVPLPSNNESVPSLPSFAEGGSVPNSGAPIPRPASVPSSDTTLAWLTPGEVVQSLSAVRKYGADFLLALNEGIIDPMSLRSMAGLESHRKVRRSIQRSGALHFAEGGLVPAAGVQATRDAVSESSSEEATPPIALVVGNDQSLDRLLAGGKRAMLDFIKSNAAAIDGVLARNRT